MLRSGWLAHLQEAGQRNVWMKRRNFKTNSEAHKLDSTVTYQCIPIPMNVPLLEAATSLISNTWPSLFGKVNVVESLTNPLKLSGVYCPLCLFK